MTFQASEREFRGRFWVIGSIFGVGFGVGNAVMPVATAQLLGEKLGSVQGVLAAGTAMVALGALVRSWAEAYLKSEVVHEPSRLSDRLVADGPYRRVRNPLYLGNVFLALGMGLLASPVGYAFIVAAMVLFSYRLILHEEAGLLASQGESYRRYLGAVPRLLPSLAPRLPAGSARPDWRDGFLGEGFFWSFTIGMAALTVTGSMLAFGVTLAAGFALYFLQAALRKKKV